MVLRVLVVGGGIAGLATALSLRRAAHQVQVFEASQLAFADTAGPIIHLGPRSSDLLRQWGVDTAVARGVLIREISEFNQDGTLKPKADASQPPGWEYYERSRLHRAFLDSAVASTGSGQPVELSLGTKVVSVDPDRAVITLDDGRILQGDIVVGADGFDSIARHSIVNKGTVPSGPATIAIQFSVAVAQFGHSSVIQRFQSQPQRYEKWFGGGLQLSVYAVEPGNLIFDCTLSIQGQTDLTPNVLKKEILKAFGSAHPEFVQLLAAAELKNIHSWTQPSLPRVDKWTSKRLVLVGDAAHPFLPHEQPGTSQTLNDAAALGTQLSPGVGAEDIEESLIAWETPRKERVKTIQQAERASWSSV